MRRYSQGAHNIYLTLVSPEGADLLLHEIVGAWFRGMMRRARPAVVPWEETRAQWAARAARCVKAINAEYNVQGFCAEPPGRLRKRMEHGGERWGKCNPRAVFAANGRA